MDMVYHSPSDGKLCLNLFKAFKEGYARTSSRSKSYIIKVTIIKGKVTMKQKTFQYNHEWTTIFYPDRPSGFSILLLGGEQHYILEKTNFWMEHPGKRQMVEHLLGKGYTLIGSNLGAHWGREETAGRLAELYAHFIRQEIVNEKIHVLAEGTGALLLGRLSALLEGKIRSIGMLNPELSLLRRYEKEKENKFFHKKFMKEVSLAHHIEADEVANWITSFPDCHIPKEIPVLWIQVMDHYVRDFPAYHQHLTHAHSDLEIKYVTPEKRFSIPYQMNSFFRRHEKHL